jgi:hypothetical protein
MRHVETRRTQSGTRGRLSPWIAGDPPTLFQQLLSKLGGALIDCDMVFEAFNRLRSVVSADQQLEAGTIGRPANLVHELLVPSLKAPEHICLCFGRSCRGE